MMRNLGSSYRFWRGSQPLKQISLATVSGSRTSLFRKTRCGGVRRTEASACKLPILQWKPSWSPDGRYIAAMPSDSSKLKLFDFTTKKWLELAKGGIAFPNWSQDGKYLYFEEFSRAEMRRVQIASQKFEVVAGMKELRRPNAISGFWSAPAYDGSLLVMRDIGIQEIYALDLQLP